MYSVPSNATQISMNAPAVSAASAAENTEADKCNACFGNLGNQRTIVVFPCTHSYHKSCVDQLLKAPKINDCESCSRSAIHCLSSEKRPLHVAAAKGQPDAVSGLLALGVNVNDSTKDGLTPLHCAAIRGDVATIERLVSQGASVNAQTRGMTPLHFAAEHGQTDAIWLLLHHGADINSQPIVRETPSEIKDRQDLNLIVAMMERFQGLPWPSADSNGSEAQIKSYGKTPLHSAIKAGQEEAVNALALAGADTEVLIDESKTLLRWAKSEGKLTKSMISTLAHATCDTEAPCKGTRAELLGTLIKFKEWNLFDQLWANTPDADVNKLQCPESSQLAFFQSVECGQTDNIKAMIARGANVNARNGNNKTPLYCAIDKGQPESIAMLIADNADVNATMRYGWTALHLAAQRGEASVVQLLIDAKANVNASISDGEIPTSSDIANERYMVNNTNGGTPLHIAVESCQPEIVERLIAANADVNALNTAVHTPLKVAHVLYKKEMSRVQFQGVFSAIEKVESYRTIIQLLQSVKAGSGFEY